MLHDTSHGAKASTGRSGERFEVSFAAIKLCRPGRRRGPARRARRQAGAAGRCAGRGRGAT